MIQVSEIVQVVNISVNESNDAVSINVSENVTNLTLQVAEIGIQGIQGIPGVAGQDAIIPIKIYQEVPSGLLNGINATFITINNFVSGTLELFLNGSLQKIVSDYQLIGNNTILLTNSPFAGEHILINYIKQ